MKSALVARCDSLGSRGGVGGVGVAAGAGAGEQSVERLVVHAALDELVLRQHAVVVDVHLREDVLRAAERRIAHLLHVLLRHQVDRLQTERVRDTNGVHDTNGEHDTKGVRDINYVRDTDDARGSNAIRNTNDVRDADFVRDTNVIGQIA